MKKSELNEQHLNLRRLGMLDSAFIIMDSVTESLSDGANDDDENYQRCEQIRNCIDEVMTLMNQGERK